MKGLFARLILLVWIALLPALGFAVYNEHEARQARERLIEDEALRLVRMVNADQRRIADGAEQVLDTLASTPAVREHRPDLCQRLLADLQAKSPRYANFAVIGLDGRQVCTSVPVDPSLDASDRDYFQEALRTGRFATGTYTVGRTSHQRTIHFAKPFTNPDGKLAGVVELGLNLAWLRDELQGLALPPDTTVSVSDRNGIVLAHVPDPPDYVGTPIVPALRWILEADRIGAVEAISRDGARRTVAYAPPSVTPKGLMVAVGLNRNLAFSTVITANRVGVVLIVLGAALALLTAALVGSRLIRRPVERLLAAADRWKSGDLGARSGLAADDGEFSRLGAAFDAMAVALAARERALAAVNAELEARVHREVTAREAALTRAAQAERVQALGQLAGGIAHDFNNVLQTIDGAVALIGHRVGDFPAVARLVYTASEAIARGASVTRRLLAFGRRSDLRAAPLDAGALLGDMREIFAHTLGAAVEVEVRVADGTPPILADRGQLETALVNLATNARDAMPKGGRLLLSAEPEQVPPADPAEPHGLAPGRFVRISVADTGAGMDAATLAHATDPFFTTKPMGAGTGLGLSMARGFADQSGGALAIASAPGTGTTVTLFLPAASAAATAEPSPDEAEGRASTSALSATRVLLVDDEAMLSELLAEQLSEAGYSVLVASGGTEALALLEADEAVDVLVTDLSMPDMDGLAVIRAAQAARPGLPAILLTGYAGDGAAVAVGRAVSGSFSLLRKPVHMHELTDRIQSLLASRQAAAARPPGTPTD